MSSPCSFKQTMCRVKLSGWSSVTLSTRDFMLQWKLEYCSLKMPPPHSCVTNLWCSKILGPLRDESYLWKLVTREQA